MRFTKKLWLGSMMALGLGSAVPFAFALPANEVETTYYTDATYTTDVGYTFLSCQGGVYREGRTTPYRVRTQTPCNTAATATDHMLY